MLFQMPIEMTLALEWIGVVTTLPLTHKANVLGQSVDVGVFSVFVQVLGRNEELVAYRSVTVSAHMYQTLCNEQGLGAFLIGNSSARA